MVHKTITIDSEAYERLKSHRKAGETFSQAIKRLASKPFDFDQWLAKVETYPAGDQFVQAVEGQIAARRAPRNMGRRFDALFGHQLPDRSVGQPSKKRPPKRG